MYFVYIPVDANAASWRNICDERMEKLKAKEFPYPCQPSSPALVLEESSLEYKFLAPELYEAVRKGDVLGFLDALEFVSAAKKLPLSAISDQINPGGNSLLHVAAKFGSEDIALFIAHQFPELVMRRNTKGETALHVAARSCKSELIKIILSCYADYHFMRSSSIPRVRGVLFLQDDIDDKEVVTRIRNECGNTALHEAVIGGYNEAAVLLFSADMFVAHYLNKEGKSPLYLAVETKNEQILGHLLRAPFPTGKPLPRHQGNSPLHAAVALKWNSVGTSKQLLSQPLVESWLRNLSTELVSSATCSKTQGKALLEEILESRPELLYLKDEKGGTPLHFAASIGYLDGVRLLLRKSIPIALERDTKGNLPIHIASKNGHVDVVKELLKEQPYDAMDLLNQKGQNILHVAAKNGKDKVVKYLLKNKKLEKLLNEKDNNGNTPLHLASKYMHPSVLLHLTQDKRIKVNFINNEGLTARDFVLLQRNTPPTVREILSYTILYSSGARLSEKGRNIRRWYSAAPQVEWIKDRISTLLLVAILVATVTFAAGFTVPGGVKPPHEDGAAGLTAPGGVKPPHVKPGNDPDKDDGLAVLLNRSMFQVFMICNTVAMYSSTIGAFILLWAQLGDFHVAFNATYLALYLVGLGLATMSVSFMAGVNLIVRHIHWLAITTEIIGVVFLSLFLVVYIFLMFPLGARHFLVRQISNLIVRIIIPFSGSHGKLKIDKKTKKELNQQQTSQEENQIQTS